MLYLFCKLRKFGVLVISSQWTPQLCNLCCSYSHVCCLWHQFSVHHIFHGSFNKDLLSSLVYVCCVGFCKLLYVCVHSCILQYIFVTFYYCIYLGFNWGFWETDTCTDNLHLQRQQCTPGKGKVQYAYEPIGSSGWRASLWECLAQENTTQCSQPGLKPTPPILLHDTPLVIYNYVLTWHFITLRESPT